MRFTGKIAVITAFANGIGRATAEIMAREGAVVVGVDNHRDRLDEAVAALRGAGGKAHGRLCDALDAGQVEATVASVNDELAAIAGRGLSPTSSSAYAAAKGGIIAFTRKLAYELGPFGVTINAIAPSLTLTERIRPHWEKRTQEAQAAEIARTPLRRVAEAADQIGRA